MTATEILLTGGSVVAALGTVLMVGFHTSDDFPAENFPGHAFTGQSWAARRINWLMVRTPLARPYTTQSRPQEEGKWIVTRSREDRLFETGRRLVVVGGIGVVIGGVLFFAG